jgi:hypothetical protein
MVLTSSPKMGTLVGIFEEPNHEKGRSLALHGVKDFVKILSRLTEWNSREFTVVNDVVGGQAEILELLPDMFNKTRNEISTRIHGTIANVNHAWTSHHTDELLSVVVNTEPGLESAMASFLMLVPLRYAHIVIIHQLSPRQLWA